MTKMKKKSKTVASASSSVPLRPTDDNVVVRPLPPETVTASGIIIPDTAQEKPEQGTIVAVGPGKYERGARIPMPVSVGDKVLFSKYGYEEVKFNDVEYYLVSAGSIKAVIKG